MKRKARRNDSDKRALKRLYYTPSLGSALGGARRLRGAIRKLKTRISDETTEGWLREQDPYTLHKKVTAKFPRRSTIVSGEGEQLQADLIDTQSLAKENDGYKFILTSVDVFSKRAYAAAIKNKSASVMAEALTEMLRTCPARSLQTDKGSEFLAKKSQEAIRRLGVHHFTTQNEDTKAAICERFNRTLQDRMYRWFTHTGKRRYLEALPDLIDSYNSTIHSSTGVAPNSVGDENREEVWHRLQRPMRYRTPKLSIGDHVRITKKRMTFDRGYTANWSHEIFTVIGVSQTIPITYSIEDLLGEVIAGAFYEQELQLVTKPTTFKIESVVKRRGKGRSEELLVRWYGYPDKFNQWIKPSQFAPL